MAVLGFSGFTPGEATADNGSAGRPGALPYLEMLTGVTAVSPRDAWSVGFDAPDLYHSTTLVRHWDGTRWTDVAHPEPGNSDRLYDVDAISSDNVWAVGWTAETPDERRSPQTPARTRYRPLVEHWDGSAWSVLPTDQPNGTLDAVSGVSANDVWAAGGRVVEHWDGQSWIRVALPAHLWLVDSLSARSPSDVWATGRTKQGDVYAAVVLHWDGSAWSIVYSQASQAHHEYVVSDVVALSTNDVWAVGGHDYRHGRGTSPMVPFALHWDGSSWTSTKTHKLPDDAAFLSVDATGPDDIWAVGATGSCACLAPFIEHWNGVRWTVADVPTFGDQTSLAGVHATSATDAWAVGGSRSQSVTLHWNGHHWLE